MNRLEEINKRLAEIKAEMDNDNSDIEALTTEADALLEERKGIKEQAEQRKALRDKVANLDIDPDKTFGGEDKAKGEERKMNHAVEYRNAFLKTLLGEELTETEKRAYIHTTENTGAVVPEETLNKIYSTMEEQHPILRDVQVLRTGAVISIVKHTAIVAGDAKVVAEGVANDDEQNTFVNVTLSGKDFSKHVDFSYRLGKMAIPAFEQYIVNEIAGRLGSAMAADIVAQIKTDLAVANSIDAAVPGTLAAGDVLNAFALLKSAPNSVIYVSQGTFYGNIAKIEGDLVSFLTNYQDAVSGQLIGKAVKIEDAMADGEVLVLDPKQFIYNMVQDIMLERDKDIKKHVHTISGFAIAEGTMTNDKAGALITVGTAV